MLEAVNALILAWAKVQPHIHALALCGSYARGDQRPDSDIEFSFAPLSWASTGPIEPGTRAVICNGFVPLHDPELSLHNLQQAANRG